MHTYGNSLMQNVNSAVEMQKKVESKFTYGGFVRHINKVLYSPMAHYLLIFRAGVWLSGR